MEAVRTADGSLTIKHALHGEAYHSNLGARTEATELYIYRSTIQEKFKNQNTVTVLDVGLGLGYNALSTLEAWQTSRSSLNLISLESDADILSAFLSGESVWQSEWPRHWQNWVRDLQDLEKKLGKKPQNTRPAVFELRSHDEHRALDWKIYFGDALAFSFADDMALQKINYIWHDPFSPTKNPDMWSKNWFEKVKPFCAPDCELLTYSVARTVKDALVEAGWQIERIPGLGSKKHWLRATLSV